MNPAFVPIFVFFAAVLAILGIASVVFDLFLRHRESVQSRLNEEFELEKPDLDQKTALFKDLKQLASGTAPRRPTLQRRFAEMVDQSGLGIHPWRLSVMTLVLAWLTGLIGLLLGRQWWFGGIGFAVGLTLPVLWVNHVRKRRMETLRSQLPEAFDLMSQSLRAGQTTISALQIVADSFEGLLAREFAYCYEQQNLGIPLQVALADLARRSGIMELRMFAVTMSMQRQSGGNPVEMLNNLAEVIRMRTKLAGHVKALTGEGRMQALVLLLMPPLMFLVLYAYHRSYVETLLEHPYVLLSMVASQLCGALWIRQIVNFEY